MAVRVAALEDGDEARWDAFVLRSSEATFFHRSGWARVLREVFGHATQYLLAERDGEVVGVLPLARVRSWLFGDALVSTPFCVYGGLAAADEEARAALDEEAQRCAESLGVEHLEYRHRTPVHTDWPRRDDLYATFRKAMEPDEDANFQAIPRKQRRMVRQGIKAGLQAEWETDLDRFHAIYARSVHRLGTPVFPRRYFHALAEVFGDDCRVLTVSREGRPVTSVLNFYFRDEVLPYYGGGLAEAREVAGYDFLYWEVMRRACAEGYQLFDFGRSKRDTGAYHFKRNWGFEPQALSYEYRLYKRPDVPDHNPLNPRYQRAIRIWQRLPLAVANRLGPLVVRNLG
ncbi:FemAB family PEP-CTERM system-associated protein [Halorhodospira sp. 9621]|uniref:FemAB family XrtA/PEP-CTERM system-associated protein n=1 Tax=Halorhodospira sp. 9621 TaxID=2899135 RepID=UPI001EE96AE6|nr:FemAB family XrtA/PEP-CTERM system-associated protein [Halorhodospira sp. 9621]MCG5532255.1 FemAB family PEP-CTERM system-associated protein [Halorhodospira sp. 9621]